MAAVLKNIKIDNKIALIFGIGALLLSSILGIGSGVKISVVAVRSVLMFVVFAGIGYGTLFVIKKFIPELYDVISDREQDSIPDVNIAAEKNIISSAAEEAQALGDRKTSEKLAAEPEVRQADVKTEKQMEEEMEFQEFGPSDFPKVGGADDAALNASLDSSANIKSQYDGKLGKHIVMSDSFVKYEPKVMAEAIRTMLKREGE